MVITCRSDSSVPRLQSYVVVLLLPLLCVRVCNLSNASHLSISVVPKASSVESALKVISL